MVAITALAGVAFGVLTVVLAVVVARPSRSDHQDLPRRDTVHSAFQRRLGNSRLYVEWPNCHDDDDGDDDDAIGIDTYCGTGDLWGPLLYCFTLALVLSIRADRSTGSTDGSLSDQGALLFSAVFVIVCLGATVITINALLLGGKTYVVLSIVVVSRQLRLPTSRVHV
jgi:hypothetical protein